MKKKLLAITLSGVFLGVSISAQAKATKPNVLLIVVDDLGYSDISPFGGEIPTPHLQVLADEGVKFSQFYTAPMSAPARSMIMTGNTSHEAGVGAMWWYDNTEQQKGYELRLTDRVKTMPEYFQSNGYQTLMTGKWHLGFKAGASPIQRGFNRSFALMGGGASHFSDAISLGGTEAFHTYYELDGQKAQLPEDFYSSSFYATTLSQWIKETPNDQPVFAYLAFTAPHDPIQAPDDWITKFADQYNDGYQGVYENRMEKLVESGFLSSGAVVPDLALAEKWQQLSTEEKQFESKKMQVYASMISYMDDQIGGVIKTLKETERYDNTIIIFLSDNGANAGGRELYDDEAFFTEHNVDDSLANLGRKGSFASVGQNWADVNNAPYQTLHKTTSAQGGVNTSFILWAPMLDPKMKGTINRNYFAGYDIAPTLYGLTGIQLDILVPSDNQLVMRGINQAGMLTGESLEVLRDSFALELHNQSLFIDGDWKIRRLSTTYPEAVKGTWALFNIKDDPLETNNLALENREKLTEILKKYEDFAKDSLVIEATGRLIPYRGE